MKSGCCTICLEPLFKDIQVSSECGHVFHRSCIYRWIDSANTCPNCKQHCDASQLCNLFLDPLEIIKEVLNDPTVLHNVDPDLLLKIYQTDVNGSGDDDIDSLDGKVVKKQNNMELIQERIKNSALTTKNNELSSKLSEMTGNIRNVEDENSKLHKKIQSYLKTAQKYERKFFDSEDKVQKLNIEIFKKNKELNAKKKEINDMIRKQLQFEHQENIMIGNMAAVHEMEAKVEEDGKSKEEQAIYWKSMYHWILREYKRSQADRDRDKKSHQTQHKKWSEIHEEQRIKIDALTETGMKNVDRVEKYKKHYFGLKEKYNRLKEEYRKLYKKSTNSQANKMPEIDGLNIDKENREKEQNDDDIASISYDENQQDTNEKEDEDEDDDLKLRPMNTVNAMNVNTVDSVFSYPHSNRQRQRGSTSRSLFGAYHKLQSKKDVSGNPFSSNTNAMNRKRNFSQFTKGGDARGGVKTFLTDSTNNYNNNRNKRRRVVNTSSNSNRNKNNRSKKLINFFKK